MRLWLIFTTLLYSLILQETFGQTLSSLEEIERLNLLGQKLIKLDKKEEAIEVYKKTLEMDSSNVNAFFWLGTLYRWKGEIDTSLMFYSKALQLNPNHVDALVGRARVWELKKKKEREKMDLLKAYQLDSKNPEANELLARFYFDQGDEEKAKLHLKGIYKGGEFHKILGDLYKGKNKKAIAIKEYEKALKLGLDDPEIHRSLGQLYRERENFRKSTEHYLRVIEKIPSDIDTHFWLGTLYRWRGMMKEAEREYREVLKINPEHVDAMLGLSRILRFYGRLEESMEYAKKAFSLSPHNSEVRSVLGLILESKGSFEEARKEFTEGFKINSKEEESWRGMGRMESLLQPSLGGEFLYYDSRVLEGRELAPPYPIRTRYWGYRFKEEGRYPISSRLSFTLSTEQFRDALEHRDIDFTIYDVLGYALKTGGEYQILDRLRLNGEVGEAWFKSKTDRPLRRNRIFLTREEITYEDKENRFLGRFGFKRGFLLGRSLGGTFDFGLFAENKLMGHLEKRWGDSWSWSGDLSYSFFSDHTKTFFGYTGLEFSRDGHQALLYGTYFPLQSRFLKPDLRLEFVKVAGIGGIYRAQIVPFLELNGEYRYQHYSDSNVEHRGGIGCIYTIPYFKPLSLGANYSIDDFRKISPKYNSLDVKGLTLFIQIKRTIIPSLDYNIRYAHSFNRDVDSYHADELFWTLEYFIHPVFRAGFGGILSYNTLHERNNRCWVYLRILF